MRRHITLTLILVAASLAVLAAPSRAQQQRCPEGRLANGECVHPGFARSMRQTAIVNSQPKFSYTAPLYLPFEERNFHVLRHGFEMQQMFGYPGPIDVVAPSKP